MKIEETKTEITYTLTLNEAEMYWLREFAIYYAGGPAAIAAHTRPAANRFRDLTETHERGYCSPDLAFK